MTNDEIDYQVTKKLHPEWVGSSGVFFNRKRYSESLEAAWEILEALKTPFSMHIYRMTNFEYRCVLQPTDIQARADTAALAICKAFLKLP